MATETKVPVADVQARAEAQEWLRSLAINNCDMDNIDRQHLAVIATALRVPVSETITIQEAWEAAGGNPGIKATKEELLEALRGLDEVCDEADTPMPRQKLLQFIARKRQEASIAREAASNLGRFDTELRMHLRDEADTATADADEVEAAIAFVPAALAAS